MRISDWSADVSSSDLGHHDGADCHHFGGASTLAENVWFCWNRYCSMPKKANGMHSNPRITMAIQTEVFSRSFCSIGEECLDVAGNVTRHGDGGTRPGRWAEAGDGKDVVSGERGIVRGDFGGSGRIK